MKETNYWKQFVNTGSVDAYLSYRTACKKSEERLQTACMGSRQDAGVGAYAGISERNRHDSKNGAYR